MAVTTAFIVISVVLIKTVGFNIFSAFVKTFLLLCFCYVYFFLQAGGKGVPKTGDLDGGRV